MIERLITLSLRHRALVLGAALALMVAGSYRAMSMPVDVFPDLTAPRVTVVTEASGLASEEVEELVTFPVESAVYGAAGVRRVRSASAPGISLVWVEFDWTTDGSTARQRVAERLQSLGSSLPPEAEMPLLAPASSVMGEIAFVAVTSDELDGMALRRFAEARIRRRLLAVEGVSQVVAIGGDVKQYQILLDPHRLEGYRLTLHDVLESVQRGSRNAPGGYLVDRGQESVIRVLGRARGLEDLSELLVTTRGGTPVRLSDLGQVRAGPAVRRGTASYNGQPAVMLSVVKQPAADTVGTTRRLDAVLDALETDLGASGVSLHRNVFRQLDFISTAVENLMEVLRDGALLVIAVLALFLWSFRPTLISVLAIPLSMLAALLVLDALGLSIDTMTLGGLAIAIGELVDDAIVDVENVSRRLRQRAQRPEAEQPPLLETVRSASLEVRSSIVSATYVLMLVFVPLLLLDGLEGRLLRPLSIAYLVAIFASLIVAVTVTPALCSLLLPRAVDKSAGREPPVLALIGRAYEPILSGSLRRPWRVLGLAALVVALGGVGLLRFGRSFLPEFNEGSLTINMVLEPGTSLEQSDALATMAERRLLEDPAVVSVGRRTGRAERDEHVLGVETSELEVRLRPDDPRTKAQVHSDVRERLRAVPGANFTLGQPISHRIEHMISGQRTALSIKVFGDDLRGLRRIAGRIEALAKQTPGLVDVGVEQVVDIPQLVLRIDRAAAAGYGLSAGEAASAVGTALWGSVGGHVFEESMATEVVVRYPATALEDQNALSRTRIPTPSGALVPISALAKIRRDAGPNYILRENVQRRVVVTANLEGPDAARAKELLAKRVTDSIKLPPGVRVEYAGQLEREAATTRRLLLFGLLSALGIALIVGTTLGSVRRAAIVLVNLPLSLAGGVIGVYLGGGTLSVATTIGFITLFGIATRNGILLATRCADLEQQGVARMEAAAQAARERLAPILMTALTAALGLLPLALSLGQPGSEIQAPMALVILTGLFTSTALNMVVVPALIAHLGAAPGRAPAGAQPP
ncbi:MAG: efflux RND transporter permease subunit [Myxococcales bacterium]|nr:efflux RND transporter permease subunit [Myxococcales bacterium]